MPLDNYDSWKLMCPEDEDPRCEYCGASEISMSNGWQPDRCTGECERRWRDPDAEYEAARDEPPDPIETLYAED